MFDKNFFFTPLFSTCFWIRDPGSGMGKNQDPGSGINIPDPQHWSHHSVCKPYVLIQKSFIVLLHTSFINSFISLALVGSGGGVLKKAGYGIEMKYSGSITVLLNVIKFLSKHVRTRRDNCYVRICRKCWLVFRCVVLLITEMIS